jgi:hypothetical protein
MSIFAWLFLGHFVADWLFQSDWMAIGKRTRLISWPGVIHYSVYTAIILGIIALYTWGAIPWFTLGGIGLIIFLSHWLLDASSLVGQWMRLFGQRDQPMVRIVVDQTFHLLVLALITALFLV